MPSWSDHDDYREEYWTAVAADSRIPWDPDAVEVPEPYTEAEWAETEGSLENRLDHPTHSERVADAGYDLNDPKGWSVP